MRSRPRCRPETARFAAGLFNPVIAGLQSRSRNGTTMATFTDIARRVYNHTWKLDPIVRSLLDTDFYKLLMMQMIWGLYPQVEATFSLINRTRSVRLAEEI